MKILAIDTSCDDTCVAIIKANGGKKSDRKTGEPNFEILTNLVSSQIKIHRKYGGVVPMLAKREHQKSLIPLLKKALKETDNLRKRDSSKKINSHQNETLKSLFKKEDALYERTKSFLEQYKKPEIDLLAVTQGPGLEPSLWSGINLIRALSFFWKTPIVPVNHVEAHILANFISENKTPRLRPFLNRATADEQAKFRTKNFPAVALVVSGGHTELSLVKRVGKYKILGETRDDAAGEGLDKIAKILKLFYPGGPEIEKLSRNGKDVFHLPRPMIFAKNYDFSFSGLKTAVLYLTKKMGSKKMKSQKVKADIAASAQSAVIDVLIAKTLKAIKNYKVKTLLLGGGVVANRDLKIQFRKRVARALPKFSMYYPEPIFCTDNAAMIGIAGYFNSLEGKKEYWEKIKAKANLKIY
ncbi:MAG: tRNA (adenosine(37)-N6)-threonylcarbamoyltransferase complex transferase subunit TsaD [Patescibacteria group bacterium]